MKGFAPGEGDIHDGTASQFLEKKEPVLKRQIPFHIAGSREMLQ